MSLILSKEFNVKSRILHNKKKRSLMSFLNLEDDSIGHLTFFFVIVFSWTIKIECIGIYEYYFYIKIFFYFFKNENSQDLSIHF